MKRYIARIKIEGKPMFSLICSGERDYIISPPKSSNKLNEGGYFNFHFTLHTGNNRVTQKVTNFGNNEKGFEQILDEASKGDFYVSRDKGGLLKDIGITKGEHYLDLNDNRFIGNIFTFGINDVHSGEKITDFFGESKKSDEIFRKVIDIIFPSHSKDVEIHLNVCKNFICNDPVVAYRIKGMKYEEAFVIEDSLKGDVFKFIVIVKDVFKQNMIKEVVGPFKIST